MNQTQTKFSNQIISNQIAPGQKRHILASTEESLPKQQIMMHDFVKRRMSPQDMASVIAQGGQATSQQPKPRGVK